MRLVLIAALIAVTLAAAVSRASVPARAITGPLLQIETYMGTGVAGNTGDGRSAADATITGPDGIAVAPNGDVYAASRCLLRRVHLGVVSTAADVCSSYGSVSGVAVSPTGEVYFGAVCIIMKVTAAAPAVFAGDPTCGGGPCGCAGTFDGVKGIAFDKVGNLYVADEGRCQVKKVDPSGVITTVAGTGSGAPFFCPDSGDGGLATAARINWPLGVAVADNGDLYIAVGGGNNNAAFGR